MVLGSRAELYSPWDQRLKSALPECILFCHHSPWFLVDVFNIAGGRRGVESNFSPTTETRGLTWMWPHNCGTRLLSTGYSLKWFYMYRLWLIGVLGQSYVPFFKFIEHSNALIKSLTKKKKVPRVSHVIVVSPVATGNTVFCWLRN